MYVVDISNVEEGRIKHRMQLNATRGEEERVEIEDGCQHAHEQRK